MTEEGKQILEKIEEMDTRLSDRIDKLNLAGMLAGALTYDSGSELAGIRLDILENRVKQLEEIVYDEN